VHCKAGEYQQLYLTDEKGKIISSDPSEILPVIWAEEDEPMADAVPKDYNRRIMAVKQHFEGVVEVVPSIVEG